jgi:uncharacterized protein DUF3761
MEPNAKPSTSQKVKVSGKWNIVIVVGRDFVISPIVMFGILAALAIMPPQARLHSLVSLSSTTNWPEGKTALCRDGRYSQSHHRSGTCSSHGGVAQWRFAAEDAFWRR